MDCQRDIKFRVEGPIHNGTLYFISLHLSNTEEITVVFLSRNETTVGNDRFSDNKDLDVPII